TSEKCGWRSSGIKPSRQRDNYAHPAPLHWSALRRNLSRQRSRTGPMSMPKLLIVEDDEGLCRQYRWAFPEHQLFVAQDRQAARAIIARERPAVGILDLGLPPDPNGASEGLALLQEFLERVPDAKLIVAT